MPKAFAVDVGDARVTAHLYPAKEPRGDALVLAHGAGAPQSHPFMLRCARGLAARGVHVVTFDFLYTEEKRRLPDPAPKLEECYVRVARAVRARRQIHGARFFLGGKSMGGRIASQIAASRSVEIGALQGLVFLGYPLHPPGRPTQLRSKHLPDVAAPMLFVQGARDAFGTPDEIAPLLPTLAAGTDLLVVEGGDHSFAVPKKQGEPQERVYERILDGVAAWMKKKR